jgi:predicted methyltransferase
MRRLLACLLVSLLASTPLLAIEQSAAPGINAPFEKPNYDEWVERFERGGREIYDKRLEIVAALDLKRGMVVADIGAGTGLFTRLFSPEVGAQGKVIAVDIAGNFIEGILAGARKQGLKNIQGIVNSPTDAMLPLASVDMAFICDTYHHFEYPQHMLASIHRALKPNGALVVIDYERIPGTSSAWVMAHMRLDKQATIGEIQRAGFLLVEDRPLLQRNYYLRFVKAP